MGKKPVGGKIWDIPYSKKQEKNLVEGKNLNIPYSNKSKKKNCCKQKMEYYIFQS